MDVSKNQLRFSWRGVKFGQLTSEITWVKDF